MAPRRTSKTATNKAEDAKAPDGQAKPTEDEAKEATSVEAAKDEAKEKVAAKASDPAPATPTSHPDLSASSDDGKVQKEEKEERRAFKLLSNFMFKGKLVKADSNAMPRLNKEEHKDFAAQGIVSKNWADGQPV